MHHFQARTIQKKRDSLDSELSIANNKIKKLAELALAYGASVETVKRITKL